MPVASALACLSRKGKDMIVDTADYWSDTAVEENLLLAPPVGKMNSRDCLMNVPECLLSTRMGLPGLNQTPDFK